MEPIDNALTVDTALAQEDSFFKLQYYHWKYNPGGPNSSTNCGPASLAMVLKTLGREPNGISILRSCTSCNKPEAEPPFALFTGSAWEREYC